MKKTKYNKRNQGYLKKLFICFITVFVITGLSIGLGSNFASASDDTKNGPAEHKYYKSIELEYGDTLWNIAEEYMNENYDSTQEYVDGLMKINDLESETIHESRYLTVVYYDI